jgi:hypothetical protein
MTHAGAVVGKNLSIAAARIKLNAQTFEVALLAIEMDCHIGLKTLMLNNCFIFVI